MWSLAKFNLEQTELFGSAVRKDIFSNFAMDPLTRALLFNAGFHGVSAHRAFCLVRMAAYVSIVCTYAFNCRHDPFALWNSSIDFVKYSLCEFFILRFLVQSRQAKLLKEIPDFLNFLYVCSQTKLGLQGAFTPSGRNLLEVCPTFCREIDEISTIYDARTLDVPLVVTMTAKRNSMPELFSLASGMDASDFASSDANLFLTGSSSMQDFRSFANARRFRLFSINSLVFFAIFLSPVTSFCLLAPTVLQFVGPYGPFHRGSVLPCEWSRTWEPW